MRKNGVFDYESAQLTGYYAVDMTMVCIHTERMKGKIVDTIWFNDEYWQDIKAWVKSHGAKYTTDNFEFDFDGVKLKKQLFQGPKEMEVTYFKESLEPNKK